MRGYKIFSGSANQQLTNDIAEHLGMSVGKADIKRFSDGTRKIINITEVSGTEVDIITLQDIFVFQQEGYDANNKVLGKFVATGFIPKFYEELQRKGIHVDMNIFR